MYGLPVVRLLTATAVMALIGISSVLVGTNFGSSTDMLIRPDHGVTAVGDTFTIEIVVRSGQPVNVFQGEVIYDSDLLSIKSIDYNTSIADLWAEEPWYSNGAGTLTFIGGTTVENGFLGEGVLITVVFEALTSGEASITMDEARILAHDGLGSDVALGLPIDAVFTLESERLVEETVIGKSVIGPKVKVLAERPQTDLNNDGRQTILDTSIFMAHLSTQNLRSDFDGDGDVDLADLSILYPQ